MMKSTLDQQQSALAEKQTENIILKDILTSRGINFQAELQTRKAAMMTQPRRGSSVQASTDSRSGSYGQISPTVMSTYSRSPHLAASQKYSNGQLPDNSEVSAVGGVFHGHSPAEPGMSERAVRHEATPISDMPGIFERDQQLGIDFILA